MKTSFTLFAVLTVMMAQADIWRVNNNPSYDMSCDHCFNNFADAVNNNNDFAPGDTVHLEASSVDYGDIVISKQVVLIGTGYLLTDNEDEQATNLESRVREITFASTSAGSIVEGIANNVSSSGSYLISFATGADNITIRRCFILPGIDMSFTPLHNLTITGNYIVGQVSNSPSGSNNSVLSNLNISNNYIGGGLGLYNNANGIVTHNVLAGTVNVQAGITDFYNNIITGTSNAVLTQNDNTGTNIYSNVFVSEEPDWLVSGGNFFEVNAATIFPTSGSLEDKLETLNVCTACQMGFVAGSDNDATMGIFGGINPYRRAGIPAVPSIYSVNSTNESFPGGTVNVVISTKSNN